MGKKIRPGIHVEPDMDEGYAALGFMSGMSAGISSDYYVSSVIDYAYAQMSEEFQQDTAIQALNHPDRFQHVYEPRHIGQRGFELWEPRLYGRGKNRQASFEWVDSKIPILTPEERADDPSDPMSKAAKDVSEKVWETLNSKEYIFRMRAPIMEYGLSTNITPRPGTKFLFIPTFALNHHKSGGTRKNNVKYTSVHYRFESVNHPDFSYRNPQEPSGQGATIGQFSAQWVGFWDGGGANAVWQNSVSKAINGGIEEAAAKMGTAVKKVKRSRKSSATIFTFNDAYAAEESGRNLALAFMKGKARSYASAAKYIERKGYFGGETGY